MTKILLSIVILVLIGIGIFFYFSKSGASLKEKEFNIHGQEFSILIPNNLSLKKQSEKEVVFTKGGQDISTIVIGFPTPQLIKESSEFAKDFCKYSTIYFTVYIKSVNENVEVCNQSMTTATPDAELLYSLFKYKESFISIIVWVKPEYFATEEGKSKVKQIFESFSSRE